MSASLRSWYYVDLHKQQIGPLTEDDLCDLYLEGEIGEATFCWGEGLATWTQLRETELASKFQLAKDAAESDAASTVAHDAVDGSASANAGKGVPNPLDPEAEKKMAAKREKRKRQKEKKKMKWFKPKVNTHVYVTGLPRDITEDEIRDFFSKCGVLKPDEKSGKPLIRIYTGADGQPKGDARVTYLKQESVELALKILDQNDIRPGTPVSVQQAEFQQKGDVYLPRVKKQDKKQTTTSTKILAKKLLAWDEDVDDGRGLRIVIMKQLFQPSDFKDPDFRATLEEDIREEAQKIGEVEKITVFEKNADGVVAVKFKLSSGAEKCIETMHGRWFGGKQISAEFYDGKTDYRVLESVEEEAKRLQEWDKWLESDQPTA
eukprot:tig00000037_g10073.t1